MKKLLSLILFNQNGHGMHEAFSLKNLLKLGGIVALSPVLIPCYYIRQGFRKLRPKCKRCKFGDRDDDIVRCIHNEKLGKFFHKDHNCNLFEAK